jgi:CCR4-NOT transcription complex subunit 4
LAILAIDNVEIDDHILRASFGTTKYCSFFLKNCDCPNKDCLYMHNLADENDIINKVKILLRKFLLKYFLRMI